MEELYGTHGGKAPVSSLIVWKKKNACKFLVVSVSIKKYHHNSWAWLFGSSFRLAI
jgi:hypothetical protein